MRDQIGFQGIKAAGERARIAERPQPHVDAESETVLGDLGEQPDQPPAGRLVALLLVRRPRVQKHEVDIGGDVQLAAAELAHADDHQALGAEPAQRGRNLELRKIAHRAANFVQICPPRQVARHDAQQDALPQPTKAALQARFVIVLRARERVRHFVAREGCGIGELGAELGTRREEPRGVP